MKTPYRKPHLSIADQLRLLEQRGMAIGDRGRAERYLEQLGYYRLSGYWFPNRQRQMMTDQNGRPFMIVGDQFVAGTTFQQAVDLYVFDKKLRLLFMDALERIEVSVRVKTALLLSARDPLAHRDPKQLDGSFSRRVNQTTGKTPHDEWLERLDSTTARSKEEFVQRFHSKYNTPLPLWIAIELWDFGTLTTFVGGLTHSDLRSVATAYNLPNRWLLPSWMRTLNELRNVCAHHNRLWNRVSVAIPKSPSPGDVPKLDHLLRPDISREKLYAVAAITQHFMQIISPTSSWGQRFKSLIASFPAAPGAHIRHAGFPNDWDALDLWQ